MLHQVPGDREGCSACVEARERGLASLTPHCCSTVGAASVLQFCGGYRNSIFGSRIFFLGRLIEVAFYALSGRLYIAMRQSSELLAPHGLPLLQRIRHCQTCIADKALSC